MYVKPAYNFFNHTFTSFSSIGQKVLQTCPSLTKLLPTSNTSSTIIQVIPVIQEIQLIPVIQVMQVM